jgi:hypothetical protein
MGEDAEAELGVFVKDLALGDIVAEMLGNEGLVHEDFLDDCADLLAPRRP